MEEYFKKVMSEKPVTMKDEIRIRDNIRNLHNFAEAPLYFFNYALFCVALKEDQYEKFKSSVPQEEEIYIFDEIVEISYDIFLKYVGYIDPKYMSKRVNEFDHILKWYSKTWERYHKGDIGYWTMNEDLNPILVECTLKGKYSENLLKNISFKKWPYQGQPRDDDDLLQHNYKLPKALQGHFLPKIEIKGYNSLAGAIVSQNVELVRHLLGTDNFYVYDTTKGEFTGNMLSLVIRHLYLSPQVFLEIAEMILGNFVYVRGYNFEVWAMNPKNGYDPLSNFKSVVDRSEKEYPEAVQYYSSLSLTILKYS